MIEKGLDAPTPPRMPWDAALLRAGKLIGVKRRLRWLLPDKPNHEFLVLVVDDDVELAELCSEFLKGWGFRVWTVHDGLAGLDAIRNLRPDLVLLNVIMPRMGGLEVLERLRRDPAAAGVKVILESASCQVGEYARRLGAQDHLQVPFRLNELFEKVARVLRSPP